MKILNRKIHYFNPGHEQAIWADSPYYTPPASVCKMMEDLALLPAWYGEPNDLVITNETAEASRFLLLLPSDIRPSVYTVHPVHSDNPADTVHPVHPVDSTLSLNESSDMSAFEHIEELSVSSLPALEAAPWGLSRQSIRVFETLRMQIENLIVPTWNGKYKILTGRQKALLCLSKLCSLLPEYAESLTLPRFCSSPEEIRQFIAEYPPPYIFKTPYSCSGRGLYRLPDSSIDDIPTSRWIEGAIRKQGVVSIERALEKVLDFAMEFSSDGQGNIEFEGLAVFSTTSKGIYSGNMLGTKEMLERELTKYVSGEQLQKIKETLTDVLASLLGRDYQGFLGVDMLIYRSRHSFAIHPCIEINLRRTMGLVALQISNRLIHNASKGQFIIDYHKSENSAYDEHLRMQSDFPLQVADSKIISGYLSLCPVLPKTKYRAFIIVTAD